LTSVNPAAANPSASSHEAVTNSSLRRIRGLVRRGRRRSRRPPLSLRISSPPFPTHDGTSGPKAAESAARPGGSQMGYESTQPLGRLDQHLADLLRRARSGESVRGPVDVDRPHQAPPRVVDGGSDRVQALGQFFEGPYVVV